MNTLQTIIAQKRKEVEEKRNSTRQNYWSVLFTFPALVFL